MTDTASIVTLEDMSPRERWETEITAAEKELDKFYERGEMALNRYMDQRDAVWMDARWFNIFYSNVGILESALYAQIPKPEVKRTFDDYLDQTARVGANVLQRCLEQDLYAPGDSFNGVMKQCVQDRLVPGGGFAWLRLETETENIPESEGGALTNNTEASTPEAKGGADGFMVMPSEQQPTGADMNPPGQIIPLKRIKHQRVVVDYVHWKDFVWSPCRVWEERRWVARKVYMTKDQLKARFGEAKADLCSLDYKMSQINSGGTDKSDLLPKNNVFKKATVYEIWDRENREVIWYAPGYGDGVLDTKDDFLHLEDFDPCPKPMLANVTNSSTVPRPDYYMLRDQYEELNTVNARINLLVQACKVSGVYNQNAKGIADLLQGGENKLIPVENWSQFSEKGGTEGNIEWLPLEVIVEALTQLTQAREAIKGQIYELSGIADIVRGASKASETLGAQQIKAQFASVRIQKLQGEVAEYASDILRIKAEIMVKHFTPEMLIRKSAIYNTPDGEYLADAIALIKSEEGFNWRVCIKADTMAQIDYASEKAERIEFMSAVTGYFAQALPMAQQAPEMKPIIIGLLKWGITGFKKSSDIEGLIDKQLSLMEGKPPAPPPPDPKIQSEQIKQQTMMQKAKLDEQQQQMDMVAKQEEMKMKREEMQLDMAGKQMELEFKREEMQLKAQESQQNLQMAMQKNQVDMQTHQQVAQQKMQDAMVQSDLKQRQGEQQLELSERQGEQQLELAEKQGSQKLEQGDAAFKQSQKQEAAKAKPKKGE